MSGEVVVGWRWSGLMLPRWWSAVGSSTEKYFRLGDLSTLENRCFWVLRRIQRQQLGLSSPERDVDVCNLRTLFLEFTGEKDRHHMVTPRH